MGFFLFPHFILALDKSRNKNIYWRVKKFLINSCVGRYNIQYAHTHTALLGYIFKYVNVQYYLYYCHFSVSIDDDI